MSRQRLVITGAGGFSGEHACRYFSANGWEVTAVLRQQATALPPKWLNQVAVVEYCDLASREETEALIQRVHPEYVLHLAGMNAVGTSWSDPIEAMQSNVMGTLHLLEAVRRQTQGSHEGRGDRSIDSGASLARLESDEAVPTCRVLVIGSMLSFKLPFNLEASVPPHPYSLSKTIQTLLVQSWASLYGLNVIAAEPANLIGPGQSTGLCTLLAQYTAESERRADNGMQPPKPFRLSSRTEQRDLLDVRDAIRAYEQLLKLGEQGRVYPVTSGVMRSLGELVDLFNRLGRVPLQWEIGESQAASPIPEQSESIRQLGWSPHIVLEQSLLDALNEARHNY